MIRTALALLITVLLLAGVAFKFLHNDVSLSNSKNAVLSTKKISSAPTSDPNLLRPLSIEFMRKKAYPGSAIIVERTLQPGKNYNQYLVSYISEGLKIYGLLTVPIGKKPTGGYPVILFNHGYIPPASYSTISSYSIMVAPLASAGFIVFKPDYRGNGNSEGTPTQPYVSSDYITDSMNALASIENYKNANPNKIGVIGHSMGGNIALHELVMTHHIKAAELLAGVVGNETDLATWWAHRFAVHSIVGNDLDTYYAFEKMEQVYGSPTTNPSYWNAIDPTKFVGFITAPIQIQVGSADEDVPITFSSKLNDLLSQEEKKVNYRSYSDADHNLAPDTAVAIDVSVAFFKKTLQ